MIVVDASVLLAAEDAASPMHADAAGLLEEAESLATVDLAVWEVTNVADRIWRDPGAGRRLRERIWLIAAFGRIVAVDAELAETAAGVVAEHGLSGYDAAYVSAARRLRTRLASCDVRDLVGRELATVPGDLRP